MYLNMEHKKPLTIILSIILFAGHLPLYPHPRQPESDPLPVLVKNIGLVRGNIYNDVNKPESCIVAIEAAQDIYFKLEYQGRQIKGGLLKSGINLVDFHVPELYSQSGAYRYNLALKVKDKIFNRTVIIESSVNPLEEIERRQSFPSLTQSQVSMFVAHQMVATKQKHHQMRVTTQTAGEPIALDYGHYDQVDGRYRELDRAGFSPLILIGLALTHINKNREKEIAKTQIKSLKTIHTDYLQESPDGTLHKYHVAITITATSIQGDFNNKIP